MNSSLIDFIFLTTLFMILSFPRIYKHTDRLTFSVFKIIKNNHPTNNGIIIHGLIFLIVIYFYFKNKEQFNNICPPGFKLRDPENSVLDPSKSWCELGEKRLEDSDEDPVNNNEKKELNLCEVGYTSTKEDSYFNDRKSWCKKNN